MKVLLIEDDECIAKSLETILTKENYAVDVALDGEFGWRLIEAFTYDLILLDVVLPKLDGITLCRQIRQSSYQTPILLLTACDSSQDRVLGLDAGADDYMVKPFERSELLARMRVLLRRGSSPVMPILKWHQLQLDPVSCQVQYGDRPLQLTPKEYRLLELLLRKPRFVFSRTTILEHLWGSDEPPGEDTVTAHIKGVRQKLKQAGAPANFIETVYGIGYRLRQDIPAAENAIAPTHPDRVRQELEQSWRNQEIRSALQIVWEKYEPQNQARIELLERAIATLQTNSLSESDWQQAQMAAHKLAGTLGLFERAQGSQMAKQLEDFFRTRQAPSPKKQQAIAKLVTSLKIVVTQSPPSPPAIDRPAPLLCIVDTDAAWPLPQTTALRLEQISDLGIVWERLAQRSPAEGLPDLWLVSLPLAQLSGDRWAQLSQLACRLPPVPILIFTDRAGLDLRVKLARAGVDAVFPTAQVEQMIAWAARSTEARSPQQVLMVDDDPQMLAAMRACLQPWGLQVTTLERSNDFWQTLQSCNPDLLILDIEMPNFSGIELCQAVRNSPDWNHLPIVFLTAHTDAETLHRALNAGATALLRKPMTETAIVRRILSELHRSQQILR